MASMDVPGTRHLQDLPHFVCRGEDVSRANEDATAVVFIVEAQNDGLPRELAEFGLRETKACRLHFLAVHGALENNWSSSLKKSANHIPLQSLLNPKHHVPLT